MNPRQVRSLDITTLGPHPACPWCGIVVRRVAKTGRGFCDSCDHTVTVLDILVESRSMTVKEAVAWVLANVPNSASGVKS